MWVYGFEESFDENEEYLQTLWFWDGNHIDHSYVNEVLDERSTTTKRAW